MSEKYIHFYVIPSTEKTAMRIERLLMDNHICFETPTKLYDLLPEYSKRQQTLGQILNKQSEQATQDNKAIDALKEIVEIYAGLDGFEIETAKCLGYTVELSTNDEGHVIFDYVKELPKDLPFELRY